MKPKFFVFTAALFALVALVTSTSLEISSMTPPPAGQVLAAVILKGDLQSKTVNNLGDIALVVATSNGATTVVDTDSATLFFDNNGAAIGVKSLLKGHTLEMNTARQGKKGQYLAVTVKDLSYVVSKSKVSVSKNIAFRDATVSAPTGNLNSTSVKVASFVVSAPMSDDALVTSVVLRDVSGACASQMRPYVDNFFLNDPSTNNPLTVAASSGVGCPSYKLGLSKPFFVRANNSYIIDVMASLTATTASPMPLFSIESVSAESSVSGADMSANNLRVTLQSAHIIGIGSLTVQTSADTPLAGNYLFGATDQTIGKFTFSAGETESVDVRSIILSFVGGSAGANDAIQMVRLYDVGGSGSGVPIGNATVLNTNVGGSSYPGSNMKHAQFYLQSGSFVIPAGSSKTLAIKADFLSYGSGAFSSTGQVITPVVLSALLSTAAVQGVGLASGATINGAVLKSATVGNSLSGAYAAPATLYRAKLTAGWFSDTPVGASSAGARQVVGKFFISNITNDSNYIAQVKFVNPEIISTFDASAKISRYVEIYKDSLNTTALGQVRWQGVANKAQVTGFTDSTMTDVNIPAGAIQTFYVTLDTSDAHSMDNLSLRLPIGGIHWSDGVSSDITTVGNDLPLTFRTFTY